MWKERRFLYSPKVHSALASEAFFPAVFTLVINRVVTTVYETNAIYNNMHLDFSAPLPVNSP